MGHRLLHQPHAAGRSRQLLREASVAGAVQRAVVSRWAGVAQGRRRAGIPAAKRGTRERSPREIYQQLQVPGMKTVLNRSLPGASDLALFETWDSTATSALGISSDCVPIPT